METWIIAIAIIYIIVGFILSVAIAEAATVGHGAELFVLIGTFIWPIFILAWLGIKLGKLLKDYI